MIVCSEQHECSEDNRSSSWVSAKLCTAEVCAETTAISDSWNCDGWNWLLMKFLKKFLKLYETDNFEEIFHHVCCYLTVKFVNDVI